MTQNYNEDHEPTQPLFCYASYYSRERALAKLEDMFANGDVCEGEHPGIYYRGGRWCIYIAGN